MRGYWRRLQRVGSAALFVIAVRSGAANDPAQGEATLGRAADNKIYAQQLVNELMAKNPDLVSAGLHAIPPHGKDYVTVAQTKDIIGRKSSEDDLAMIALDETRIRPDLSGDPPRIKTNAPLRDRAGRIIGLAALSFKPGPGVTNLSVHARLAAIIEELARKLPDASALFQPIP